MQRDIGNELIVAIAVVAVLAFAIVFGIVLSLSSSSGSLNLTQTVVTAESNVAALDTTVPATDEPIAPSETTALTATTSAAEATEAPLTTQSPESPSPTQKITQTPKSTLRPTRIASVSTAAPTAASTEAPTALAASATAEPSESEATTAARTPIPTETARPTLFAAATEPPTETREPTPVPVVATVGEGTLVFAQPTRATGQQAMVTPRPTIGVILGTTVPGTCPTPTGWLAYTVGEGETLYAVARATGVHIDDLLAANCLPTADVVTVGSTIFVPHRPVMMLLPGETVMPGVLFVEGCTMPNVQISSPVIGVALEGIVEVRGTAALDENFGEYRIEIFSEDSPEAITLVQESKPVVDDLLGTLDTAVFEEGLYWIRLVVLARGETVRLTCAIPTLFN